MGHKDQMALRELKANKDHEGPRDDVGLMENPVLADLPVEYCDWSRFL